MIMKKIILLEGASKCGKDYFYKIAKTCYHSIEKVSFAAPMKKIAAEFFNCSLEELEEIKDQEHGFGCTPRVFLQQIGDFGKNIASQSVWIRRAIDSINQSQADVVIVTDLRFLKELEYMREIFACKAIKIKRPGVINKTASNGHASEAGLPDELFDEVIINDGEGYPEKVVKLLGEII